MDNQKFGRFVKELRKKANLTQKELGEKINVTDKAVSKWERGLSFPDITIINSLAETFGISASELLNAELGKKEEIDIDKIVKEAVENYKNTKEKRRKFLQRLKYIGLIFSILLFIISLGIQALYLVIIKKNNYEYVIDSMPYILNEVAIITGSISLFLIIKKSIIKNIIISILFIVPTLINTAFLLNSGLDNKCIVSISKDFKNEVVLKMDKESGSTTFYNNVRFYIWAKPKEKLSYEARGKFKCQWLETDICNITYEDKNKNLQTFVATYGDRQKQKASSYYYVINSINGAWSNGGQYSNPVRVTVDSGQIKVTKNEVTEIFDYTSCKQFGTIAIVLYNDKTPRYVIGLNKDCEIDNRTELVKDNGTITICEVRKEKTKPEELFCITSKNNDDLINYNKVMVEENDYVLKNGKLYISYDGKDTIEVPGKFENMTYTDYNYQISKEKTIFYYDYHNERYLVYSDDMGENWKTSQISVNGKIECIQFINSKVGYILLFEDFAMGVASGKISKTIDGGETWQDVNYGIGEGPNKTFKSSSKIKFINENIGFLTMPQSSGESSDLYVTKDGGKTFNKLELFESDIYDYYNLPTEENGNLNLKITQGSDGDYNNGDFITYTSKDNAESWNKD